MALAVALFAMTALLMTVTSALLVGSAGIRATRNYRGASQVHFVAESGIAHALQVVNRPGVTNFRNDVVNQWTTVFGTGTRSFGPLPGYTYSVSPLVDLANPLDFGHFVATATGPEGVRNVVVARVNRANPLSTAPGAVYLATNGQSNATFNGNSFIIDGNDRNYTGGAGPGAPIPGISARTAANTQETIDSLNQNQRHDVTGLGYVSGPPVVPSVSTSTSGPSVEQMNQFVADLLGRIPPPLTIVDDQINNAIAMLGWCSGGSLLCHPVPQVTYFNSGSGLTIRGTGNISGAGIMIVEGDLIIQGTLDFVGLVIVRGRTRIEGETAVTGHARLWGSLWTNDVNLVVGGDAFVQYSTQALTLASLASGGVPLPAPVQIVSLVDCAQVPAGTSNCP
jgi:hypothetical protein